MPFTIAALFIVALCSCNADRSKPYEALESEQNPEGGIVIEGLGLDFSSGKRNLRLEAQKATGDERGFKMSDAVLRDRENPELSIKATSAEFVQQGESVSLDKGVKGKLAGELEFSARSFVLDPESGTWQAKGNCRIKRHGLVLESDSFTGDLSGGKLSAKKVRAKLVLSGKD